ncbi:MAG: phosphoribosylformylglycinamidine synthase, partial [Firmicutes bacterium]|nr:phosphoribosylformylglycinamidine synthase [Bacillota bacterium]
MVRRIYVEKKPGFDVEAQGLFQDMKQNLRLEGLTGVRVLNRYDIDHIQDAIYEQAKYTVFAEAAIDTLYEEDMPADLGDKLFAVAYLPGQYDQRADSAVQCIRMINPESLADVRFARVIALQGELTEAEMQKVIEYNINPVDSCEVPLEKPENLDMEVVEPEDVATIEGFIAKSEDELEAYRKEMGFAMSHGDIVHVQNYFKNEEKRDPKVTELKVIDTYWSDHCRHTTFQTVLESVDVEEGAFAGLIQEAFDEYMAMRKDIYGDREKDVCLMDLACIGTKYLKKLDVLHDLDESDEINACSIKVTAVIDGQEEDWLVMFKNETHNHPTEIEPFGGAATCLGGAIRDPLSGRVYVYQAMRVTGAADPRTAIEDTIHGKLPQRKITRGAAHGYSSYGNQIGLATGQVSEIYHPNYVAKRMEVGAVIGAAPADHVVRDVPADGDVIILVGGRTGRDGCGGATGSSKEHTEESILTCGAEVQKGNPPVERNIQRLFRRKEASTLIKRCNDFGAGGVSVAIGELADSLEVNLDLVPKKYEGLDGTELAISESQERMAVCVRAEDAEAFMKYAAEENLESTVVAKVCDHGRFKMFWRGQCILDLSRDFLNTNGVKQYAKVAVSGGVDVAALEVPEVATFEEALGDLNCCSQKGMIDRFDSTIGAGTVLMPLGGKYQLTPACGMAAKLPLTKGYTDTTTLMAYGYDPQLSEKSPYHGAMYAVIDSVTKLAAMGGDMSKARLSFQEFFEKLGNDPQKWGRPMMALLGALKVQKELQIPAIGGKDSMSGTFMDISVPPTLISFAVGVTDANQVLSPEFKKAGSKLVLVETKKDERGVIDFV